MGFPDQLKKARLNMDYTQQQVADLMGITKSTYCGYETGKRQPDVTKIKQLACILNTSGDVLLETGFEQEPPFDDVTNEQMFNSSSNESSKFDKAFEIFKSLRPDFQDYALDQIKKLVELQDKN